MGCFPNVDAKYTTLWFGETFCFASVNCYALISGYVMYNHKATAGKLLNMWGQVFSISALTGLYFIIFKDANIPADKISDAFRPLTRSQYWYFTAYFGMYIIIPILNGAINWMEKELHKNDMYPLYWTPSKWAETPKGIKEENFKKMVRQWVRMEDANGPEVLKHKSCNKVWTPEEKLNLITQVITGNSYKSVAIENGISAGMLINGLTNIKF